MKSSFQENKMKVIFVIQTNLTLKLFLTLRIFIKKFSLQFQRRKSTHDETKTSDTIFAQQPIWNNNSIFKYDNKSLCFVVAA